MNRFEMFELNKKEGNLYVIIDYPKDKIVLYTTNKEAAEKATKALNKAEEEYNPEQIRLNIPFFET